MLRRGDRTARLWAIRSSVDIAVLTQSGIVDDLPPDRDPYALPCHQLHHTPLSLDEIESVKPGTLPGELFVLTSAGSCVALCQLHHADGGPKPRIAVAPVPDHGVGAAINDRLARAAHPNRHPRESGDPSPALQR